MPQLHVQVAPVTGAGVAWLAPSQSSSITGQTLTLDGGLTLGIDMPLPAGPLPGSARPGEGS